MGFCPISKKCRTRAAPTPNGPRRSASTNQRLQSVLGAPRRDLGPQDSAIPPTDNASAKGTCCHPALHSECTEGLWLCCLCWLWLCASRQLSVSSACPLSCCLSLLPATKCKAAMAQSGASLVSLRLSRGLPFCVRLETKKHHDRHACPCLLLHQRGVTTGKILTWGLVYVYEGQAYVLHTEVAGRSTVVARTCKGLLHGTVTRIARDPSRALVEGFASPGQAE